MRSIRMVRLIAAALAASAGLLGTPAHAESATIDVAYPDYLVNSFDFVRCTTGNRCDLSLQSYLPPSWGCYEETVGGVTLFFTQCQVLIEARVTAQVVPNGHCLLSTINGLSVSFVSGVNAQIGGSWHQEVAFAPVPTSVTAVGITKFTVVMHGGGNLEGQFAGGGSLYGEFDLTFPGAGLKRDCKATTEGKLVPRTNSTVPRYDGSIIEIASSNPER